MHEDTVFERALDQRESHQRRQPRAHLQVRPLAVGRHAEKRRRRQRELVEECRWHRYVLWHRGEEAKEQQHVLALGIMPPISVEAHGDQPVLCLHHLVAVVALAQDLAVILREHRHEFRGHVAGELLLQNAARDCEREREAATRLRRGVHLRRVRRRGVRPRGREQQPRRVVGRQHT